MVMVIDRVMGFYPVSVPTSLALESMTLTGEFMKEGEPPIDSYDVLMVNLRTLIRNAVNAFGKDYTKASIEVLVSAVEEDMFGVIQAIEYGNHKTDVEFYYCDYSDLPTRFPNANFFAPKTERQTIYAELTEKVFKAMREKQYHDHEFKVFDWKLSGSRSTLLLTHVPLDLISSKDFPTLNLIESHTGKIKTKTEFSSKLKLTPKVKERVVIPFNGLTLQIFGDGCLFNMYSKDLKDRVIKVAEKSAWHLLTTEQRMKDTLKLNDKYAYELVKNLVYS